MTQFDLDRRRRQLGDPGAAYGLFAGLSPGAVARVRSPYKVWVENFDSGAIADAAALAAMGATVTEVGVVANQSISSLMHSPQLGITPGTAADTGYNIQFNVAASQATYVNDRVKVPAPFSVISTTMAADRELIQFIRFSLLSSAATWNHKALLGWFVDDTSLLSPTTGAPTVAAGGGVGFHIGEDGVISVVCNDAAITVAGTPIATVGTLTASRRRWFEAGFRMTVTNYTEQSGKVDFYFGLNGKMKHVLSTVQQGTLPIVNAAVYSPSLSILNGPSNTTVMTLDSMLHGLTRISESGQGLTDL